MQSLPPEQLSDISTRDEQRRARVMEMVGQAQLQSAEEYFHAAMVLQHGKEPEEHLLAHELATIAGFKDHKSGKWLSAATLDRFLQSLGRPQRSATHHRRHEERPLAAQTPRERFSDRLRPRNRRPPPA